MYAKLTLTPCVRSLIKQPPDHVII